MAIRCLIIGNYREQSGWSKQLENHILALDSAGVEVIPRHIRILGNNNTDINPRVQELEQRNDKNPDVIILNTLPSMYEKSRIKTGGYFVCESSNFRASGWQHKMNMVDFNLCPCYHNKVSAIDSGVKKPIYIVPEAIDVSRYRKEYPVHSLRTQHQDKFLFLCVAEWTVRKNVDAIIRAFHAEFSPTEGVELIIKTTPIGMQNPQQDINNRLEGIKRSLKLYNDIDRYKKENVICGFLSETDMCSLYQSVDCVVNASRGEAFCIPVAEGMGFGKTIISGNHSGLDYVNDKNAYVLDSYEQPCFTTQDTLQDLYIADEYWREIRIQALRAHMRSAFEKRSLNIKKIQAGRETVKQFSIENVGRKYKQILEKI